MDKQENAKKVKVPVPGDKKRYCSGRYEPGRWNGLSGGSDYAQYFDMEDINRVRKMEEVAFALEENGIG